MPFETTLRKQFRRGFVWPRLIDMECHTLWIRKDEEIACSWTHEVERAVNAEASVAEILGKCRGQKPSCSRVFSGKPLMRPENSGVEMVPREAEAPTVRRARGWATSFLMAREEDSQDYPIE